MNISFQLLYWFLRYSISSPIYSFSGFDISISGSGSITQDGVRKLGNYNKAKYLTIHDGISEISDSAFLGCVSLETVSIPSTITRIGSTIFYDCSKITFITVSSDSLSYTNDSYGALLSFDLTKLIRVPPAIDEYVIPNRVETIDQMAFQNSRILYLTIPRFVTSILWAAFHITRAIEVKWERNSMMKSLSGSSFRYATIDTLILPSSLETISSSIEGGSIGTIKFEEGSNLKNFSSNFLYFLTIESLYLPSTVQFIPSLFIVNCYQLVSFRIPRDCYSIQSDSIKNCPKLWNITVEEGNQFYVSTGSLVTNFNETQIIFFLDTLSELNLSSKVESVSLYSIRDAEKLTLINVDPNNQKYSSDNGMLFNKEKTTLIAVCGGITSISIPESVNKLQSECCASLTKLTSVDFEGENITEIGSSSFSGCKNLTKIRLPKSIVTVRANGFSGCPAFSDFDLGKSSIRRVEDQSFFETCLPNVSLTNDFLTAGYRCFGKCKCSSVIMNCSCDICGTEIFKGSFVESLVIGNFMRAIPIRAFYGCFRLNSIVFEDPSNLESIYSGAFYQTVLVNITLPSSLTSLSQESFGSISTLKSVSFEEPSNLSGIGPLSFTNCVNLNSVHLPINIESVDPTAFLNDRSLSSFDLINGNNLKIIDGILYNLNESILILCPPGKQQIEISSKTNSILSNAFYCCLMKTLSFGNSKIDEIMENTFFGCTNLKSIELPFIIRIIGTSSFNGCVSLENVTFRKPINQFDIQKNRNACSDVYYVDSLIEISKSAFEGCTKLKLFELNKLKNIKYIRDKAFFGCSSLQLGFDVFENFTNLELLGISCFEGCHGLSSLQLPLVKNIPDKAFKHCSSLKQIQISSITIKIGVQSFSNCNLLELKIPSSITEISTLAIDQNPNLEVIFVCGTSSNFNNIGTIKISSYSNLTAYVTMIYPYASFYNIKINKVLYHNCNLITPSFPPTQIFTLRNIKQKKIIIGAVLLGDKNEYFSNKEDCCLYF